MERELAGTIERWFYWLGAVAFIAVVAYGFSFTLEQNLLHPKSPRPGILYVHAAIFASWLLLFLTQATLVRARQMRLHRSLGLVAIGLGTALPILVAAQVTEMYSFVNVAPWWMDIAHKLLA